MKVGLTGGIGTGKSTVAQIFAIFGVPIYTADKRAKEIIHLDPDIRRKIVNIFGEEAYVDDIYQTDHIAAQVFEDKKKLKKLNSIVHPAVQKDFDNWYRTHLDKPYVIKEVALIFEINSAHLYDRIICVSCPKYLRIERLRKSRGLTRKRILEIMNSQLPDKTKKELSDFVIVNNLRKPLVRQVLRIHQQLSAQK